MLSLITLPVGERMHTIRRGAISVLGPKIERIPWRKNKRAEHHRALLCARPLLSRIDGSETTLITACRNLSELPPEDSKVFNTTTQVKIFGVEFCFTSALPVRYPRSLSLNPCRLCSSSCCYGGGWTINWCQNSCRGSQFLHKCIIISLFGTVKVVPPGKRTISGWKYTDLLVIG